MSKISNISKLYIFSGSYMLLILLPIIVPFLQGFGISMAQVFQLQGVFALSVLIFEVPSGYIADLWGKKRCLMVGGALNGLGYSWLIFADGFWDFVLFELLVGAAASMYSGADVALLYDSLKTEEHRNHNPQKLVGGMLASRSFAEAGAAVLNSLILMIAPIKFVLYVQILVGWLPLVIAATLEDPHVKPMVANHFENLKTIIKALFFESKILRLISLNMILWGMSTFYAVWLFQKYWQTIGVSLSMFGWLWASYNLTVAISSKLAHRLEEKYGTTKILMVLGLLPIVGYLGMAMSGAIWGVAFGLLFQIGRGLHQVMFKDALNQRIAGEYRATANSVISFGFRGVFFLTGPIVGYSIDNFKLENTLVYLAIGFLGLFGILFLPLVKEIGVEKASTPE